jgi:hypothetical protein
MRQGTGNEPHFDWPLGEGERGREVWYSLVTHPDRGLAFWYRYTLLSTDSGHQEARLWAGLTRENGDGFLTTRSYPLGDAALGEPFGLSFGDAELTDSSARGALETDVADVSWGFEYETDDVTFTPLRSEKLTDLAERFLGSGRHWSANQSVAMDGTLEVDGETYDFEGAPGHQGHTVGETSPDGWSWLHCNCFEEDAVIEVLNVEGKTSLCFRLDGEVYTLNRLKDVVGPLANETVENEAGRWRLRAKGEGVRLDVRVTVGDEDVDKWRKAAYLTPDDTSRYVAHSSLSDVEVVYRLREDGGWTDRRTLESDAARAEWAGKTPPVGGAEEYTPEEFA